VLRVEFLFSHLNTGHGIHFSSENFYTKGAETTKLGEIMLEDTTKRSELSVVYRIY
jgi:hypothetical protein